MSKGRARIALICAAIVLFSLAGLVVFKSGKLSRECTVMGCRNAVVFDLATLTPDIRQRAAAADFCANDVCANQRVTAEIPMVNTNLSQRTVHSVSLSLKDGAGKEILRLDLKGDVEATEQRDINGPGCDPPACWHLNLAAGNGTLAVETDKDLSAHALGTR